MVLYLMHVSVVIPARFASTRFPGKPLAKIFGKPMIQWVYERSACSAIVDRVMVATDDLRIADVVSNFGGDVVLTSPDHRTGTDRLAEVACNHPEMELIVNVQGDEPLIDPLMIEAAVRPLLEDQTIMMGTLKTPLTSFEEFLNPNVVKVITDQQGFALYFSRAAIPYAREFNDQLADRWNELATAKHIGLYAYRREFLLKYPQMTPTPLEQLECLEQLRAMEHGVRIYVAETSLSGHGVDTPEDLEKVEKLLSSSQNSDGSGK
jgi:3-deoxy-manno-octulosonate cytidylyltransferase (CMP-KDO synthetase)